MTVRLFIALLAAVALMRLVEVVVSRRHQRTLRSHGAHPIPEPNFAAMVAVHTAVLIGAAVEVVWLNRPFLPVLAAGMGVLVLLANAVRWWVIATMGSHWNVQVMDSTTLGVVTSGPFRFVRHPNYAAVFVELAALPLVHTAWLTAAVGAIAHARILAGRLAVEEPMLLRNPAYRAAMLHKPRFVPSLRRQRLC